MQNVLSVIYSSRHLVRAGAVAREHGEGRAQVVGGAAALGSVPRCDAHPQGRADRPCDARASTL